MGLAEGSRGKEAKASDDTAGMTDWAAFLEEEAGVDDIQIS